MGKKYFDTKKDTLESSILSVWQEAVKKNEDKLDPVNKNAVKKKFDDRKDKDIDNDGDVDSSDKFLHKRRKAVSKAMKDEGNAFGKALKDAKEKGEKTFVVAGKTYEVKEEVDLDEKPADFISLKFNSPADVKKANKWMDQNLPGADQGFTGMDASGTYIDFENVDDAEDLMAKLKKAGFKFKVDYREEVDEGLEDSPNPANSQHLCAKNVVHEEWGAGQPVRGMHDTPDDDGNIAWYDVMFEHGIEKGVSINELKVTKSESHHHGEKKKDDEDKEMLKAKKEVKEYYEIGTDEYRDHTLDVTPGQDDPEWVAARDFKVTSMKEALAKVWGLDEKALDKSSKEEYDEEDEELKSVKGSKTMTGGKVAKVEIQPKTDG